ncbi:MAG: hypothetical protein LQ341_006572, partial [Variospora aurantia]
RLRFAGLAYTTDQGAPVKAPRGKIPYLHISKEKNGGSEMLSDTQLISEKLVAGGLADDLNGNLTAAEKAHDLAFRALLEDKFSSINYERWEQNYYTMRSGVLSALPYPAQILVGKLAYNKMSATLYGQGTSRFTPEEITKFKTEIWENVDALLTASREKATKKKDGGMFFVWGGETPTEADTTLFAFIASGLVCDA